MRSMTAIVVTIGVSITPAFAQQPPLKTTQQVFSFGGADAPEHYAFSATPRLAVDEAGHIYARVARDATVLVFDSDGRFLRRIGRKGEGPGEFGDAAGHGFVHDTLWVRNWPTPRISLFRRDGSHIRTLSTAYDFGHHFGAGPVGLSGLMPGGRAYAIPPSPVIGVRNRIRLPVLVGAVEMQRPDTIALLPNPRGLFIPEVGTWTFDPVPASPLVAVSSRGTVIAVVSWSDTVPGVMLVRLVGSAGDLRWERRFRVPGSAIPNAVRDSLIAEGVIKARPQIEAERRRGSPVPGSFRDLVARGLDLPRYYAPARRILIGIDGSVWIEQMAGLRGGTWYVLDPKGEPAFQVQLPVGFTLHEASAQWLWGVTTDDLGVAHMVKLRIVDL